MSGSGEDINECYKLIAKASKLIGSGTAAAGAWVITEVNLPSYMIDSDDSRSEASGAPTLRIYLDAEMSNRLSIHIEDFSPASGGVGGGATAEIWVNPGDYTPASKLPVWLDWEPGGSGTQPAAGDPYGQYETYEDFAFVSHDGGLTDVSGNFTPSNSGSTAGADPKIGLECREFDGNNDDTRWNDATDPTEYTMMVWARPDAVSLRNIWVRTTAFNPTSAWSHQLRITADGEAQHYTFDQGAPATLSVTGTTVLSIETYYHIAGTLINGGDMKLFVNGQEEGTPAAVDTVWTGGDRWRIGDNSGDSMAHYDGQLDTAMYTRTEFSEGQVETTYNNQNDPGDFWEGSECDAGSGDIPGSGSGTVPGSGSGTVPGSGSGTVPGSGDFEGECYNTIRRDTTFNRLVMWQERSGSVLDVMGHEALAAATPKSAGKYFEGSAGTRVDGVEEYEFQLIKSDLVKHAKKMMASQCAVHLVAFGFDTHQMWLSDSTLRAIDQRAGGGGMAGAELQLDSQYVSAAVCQVTNILECAPWNSAVAKVDVAAMPGSGSGGASGEAAVYTLQTFKKTSFNGPEWIVDEGDRVTSGGTFKGSLATLSFVFPVGTARFNFVGEWTGTIRQIGWNGGTIQEDAKTAGVDLSVTMDVTLWTLEIEVTQADERPRMVLQFAGQSQGTRDGVCIECSDPAAVAGGVPPWIIDNEGPIFGIEVGTNKFWTVNQDMTIETETDLDLSAYSIVDICRHQINGFIYGLGGDGKVYRWNGDGTGFEYIFDTGFSDATRINVSTINDKLCIGGHNIAPFNNRFYVYTLAGSALINCEARIGAGSLTGKMECFYHVGSEEWLWIYTSGGSSRFSPIDCGDKSGMQGWSVLEPRQGCIIEPDLIGYRVGGSGIYQFNPVTENNPSNASLVGGGISPSSLANNKLDWWDDDGVRRITGCGEGSRLWSWAFGQGNATLNKTTTEFRALCTRHPYVIP